MADTVAIYFAGETLEEWFQAFGKDLIHMHFIDGFIKKRTLRPSCLGEMENFSCGNGSMYGKNMNIPDIFTQELGMKLIMEILRRRSENWKALSGTTLCN